MEFKGKRATLYDNLEWATQPEFIDPIVEAGRFQKTDRVLDVGTGTGIMARTVAPLVHSVVGIDTSQEMLDIANSGENIQYLRRDIRDSALPASSYDKIISRQVFHHILEDTLKAIVECHRVAKDGGLMILAEGVPPSWEIKSHYVKVFSLKEKRIVFMEDDLTGLLQAGGFSVVKTISVWQRQMSIRNWLDNSGIPVKRKDAIYSLYPEYRELCERAYNMTMTDTDCFIDMKQVIVVGIKY